MIGEQIGNYRIVKLLGEGGMGTVWQGIDLDLDRLVAVKIISASLSSDVDLVERFRDEAKIQSGFNHPNLATLYAFHKWEGRPVMVMEYVEGETLSHMIETRGALPPKFALHLCRQALCGVEAAHKKGIVHRDLKPSNLMLNTAGVVKVMDFGIAKMENGTRRTRTNSVIGTYRYMAPEQVQGLKVDGRADIYAMGITLYEMLTGRLPFAFTADFDVQFAQVHTPPPEMGPAVPSAVAAVVMRALAKRPEDRFQNAGEFIAALPELGQPTAPPKTVFDAGAVELPQVSVPGPPPVMPPAPHPTTGRGRDARSAASRRKTRDMLIGVLCLAALAVAVWAGWDHFKEKPRTMESAKIEAPTTEHTVPDGGGHVDTQLPCPNGQLRSPSGTCVCPAGKVLSSSGACMLPQSSCADGEVRNRSGKCVCREGLVKNSAGVCAAPPPPPPPPPVAAGPLSGNWSGWYMDDAKHERTHVDLKLREAAPESGGKSSITGTMSFTAPDQTQGQCTVLPASAYDAQTGQMYLRFTRCTKAQNSDYFNFPTRFDHVTETATALANGRLYLSSRGVTVGLIRNH